MRMRVATHQPIFLPWPGFFYKALHADVLVLLDRVQFPMGRGWMHRNRVKSDQGDHWLRVPVWKTGRGAQVIADVEICNERDWRARHLRSLRELYTHAPYLSSHLPAVEEIYARNHRSLLALNLDLIRYLWGALKLPGVLHLQSELGVTGRGTELLANVCQAMKADTYVVRGPLRLGEVRGAADASRPRARCGVREVRPTRVPATVGKLSVQPVHARSAAELLAQSA
jgi:hypothetical protein